MRRFHSYGPVDHRKHFTAPRTELVRSCQESLVGDPNEGGHYFTIWAPRQTGKTWLARQVRENIARIFKDRFALHLISFGDLRGMPHEPSDGVNLPKALADVLETEFPEHPIVKTWKDFRFLFSKDRGPWKKPLLLMIDEVDTAPPELLDLIVGSFRQMYLDRGRHHLHGLALIGVRAVLGIESDRGSPFNIQRSLRVPNFSVAEVESLFRQYQDESGQTVAPDVVRKVFDATRGQPGLVGWFGELLTEKYNPGPALRIDMAMWASVYRNALHKEWNNTILNLIKKAQGKYAGHVLELFSRSDMPFSIRTDWCAYLYLNGIIEEETVTCAAGGTDMVCRFSSPFIQNCLFHTFTLDLIGDRLPILATEPMDTLTDVFDKPEIDLPALMERYKSYLKRLKARGINPWREQPRRADLHPTEAVGHFHLYAWLEKALEDICVVSPEFPTGNGRVDLHLRCGEKTAIIEVKSFQSLMKIETAKAQAAAYARRLCLGQVMIALFAPMDDAGVLARLSGETALDGVRVFVSAIGWI